MVDGPLAKTSASDQLLNMLMGQYQANQPSGPLAQMNPLWLGAAKGFLAPTRTGSFGESIGTAASGVESPLSSMRQQQMSALEKISQIQMARERLQMEAPYYQARADYYENRGAGGTGNDRLSMIEAEKWDEAASKIEITNPALATVYRKKAQDIRSGMLPASALAEIANAPAQAPAAPPAPRGQGFSFGRMFEDLGKTFEQATENKEPGIAPTYGGDVDYDAAGNPIPKISEAVDQAPPAPKQKKQAAKKQEEAPPEEAPAPETEFYTGDTAPKQYPNAMKGNDGRWYVVKEGKAHPVLK